MLKLARATALTLFATFALLALGPARAWSAATRKPPAAVQGAKPSLTLAKTTTRTAKSSVKKNPKKVPKNAPVVLYQINRRETMALRLRDGKGRPVKGMQRRFDHFLRCHYTNVEHKMDPRLMKLLFHDGAPLARAPAGGGLRLPAPRRGEEPA